MSVDVLSIPAASSLPPHRMSAGPRRVRPNLMFLSRDSLSRVIIPRSVLYMSRDHALDIMVRGDPDDERYTLEGFTSFRSRKYFLFT